MPEFSIKRARSAALAGAVGLGLTACAGGDTVATGSGYGSNLMFDTLSGVALIPKKQEPIDYSPRTGLVMPADANALPAPQDRRVVTNPAWPQDGGSTDEGALAGLSDEEKRRTIYQRIVANGGGARGGSADVRSDADRDRDTRAAFGRDLKRIRAEKERRQERTLTADGTPSRKYLTDPPLTYRAPVTATTAEGEVIARQAASAEPRKKGLRRFLPF